jgi:ABC-type transport system substrate-binding protein
VTRNTDYWKKDHPYLDGIEWTIIKNQATGQLAFMSGQFDMTSPYFFQVPMINDTQKQDPQAVCRLVPSNVNRNVMINRTAPPHSHHDLHKRLPPSALRLRRDLMEHLGSKLSPKDRNAGLCRSNQASQSEQAS